jgi:hypothetical protein
VPGYFHVAHAEGPKDNQPSADGQSPQPLMNRVKFDFKSGIVTHNSWLSDGCVPAEHRPWEYGEGLLQVEYRKSSLVLAIDWSQNGKTEPGCFVLRLIKAYNWDEPLLEKTANSVQELVTITNDTVDMAERLEQEANSEPAQ